MIVTSILLLMVILPLFIMPIVKRNIELKEITEHREWVEKSHERHMTKQLVEPAVVTKPKKLRPRDNEQFWFNLWLDNWYRQVGSKYVPLEGAADYVAPKQTIKVEPLEQHVKRQVRENVEALTAIVERADEPKPKMLEAAEVNRNFDYVMDDKRKEEYTLRYKLDPVGRLTNHQWERLYETIVEYEARMQKESIERARWRTNPYLTYMDQSQLMREEQQRQLDKSIRDYAARVASLYDR